MNRTSWNLRELQEQNRSTETIHSMDVNVEMNRDNNFANMSAEQIRAAQLSHLDKDAQVTMANAYSKDGENALLQKQQQEQKELYEKMMQMQQANGSQSQEMMLKMAQMMQQGMVGIGQQQQAFQQQRFDDQRQRADEYRSANRTVWTIRSTSRSTILLVPIRLILKVSHRQWAVPLRVSNRCPPNRVISSLLQHLRFVFAQPAVLKYQKTLLSVGSVVTKWYNSNLIYHGY